MLFFASWVLFVIGWMYILKGWERDKKDRIYEEETRKHYQNIYNYARRLHHHRAPDRHIYYGKRR